MSQTNRSPNVGDRLGTELAAIERWLTENEVKPVPAWIKSGAGTVTIQWSGEADDGVPNWKSFLAQAKALRAPFVAMWVQRLTQEEWEDERRSALEGAADADESAETQLLLEECRRHIGEVGAIELNWLAPEYASVVFALNISTPWFDDFYGREEEDSESQRESKRRELDDAEVQKLAAEVAHSPEYERATEYREREEIARTLVPSETREDEHEFYRIISAAADIFDAEILPKLQTSPEIRELAIKLANDPKFQRAGNQQARRYAAEQILPSEVLEHGTKLKLILDRAKTIYDVDLRKGRRSSH